MAGGAGLRIRALFTALDCINNIVKFVSGSFDLGMNQFLCQSVARSKVNWDVPIRENSLNFCDTPATYSTLTNLCNKSWELSEPYITGLKMFPQGQRGSLTNPNTSRQL